MARTLVSALRTFMHDTAYVLGEAPPQGTVSLWWLVPRFLAMLCVTVVVFIAGFILCNARYYATAFIDWCFEKEPQKK